MGQPTPEGVTANVGTCRDRWLPHEINNLLLISGYGSVASSGCGRLERPPVARVASNISNKRSRTAN
jgi:hypothetical protein